MCHKKILGITMSDILFPAGTVMELSDLNIEVMCKYTKQWNLEHTQMKNGRFKGGLYAVYTPRIQLLDAHYSHGFMTRGEFPDDCVMIAYIRTKSEISQYNEKIEAEQVVILTKGDEIDYFANGENKVFTLAVKRELFYQAFSNYFGESFELHQHKKHFLIQPNSKKDFMTTFASWRSYLKNPYNDAQYKMIEAEILGSLFERLDINIDYQDSTPLQLHDIRAILDASLQENKGISEIANDIGLSQRHMLRIFKETFGISPKKYLQHKRLNAVRKELLLHNETQVHIQDIALKYNFLHMGHFSSEYKKLFTETPSETRKR